MLHCIRDEILHCFEKFANFCLRSQLINLSQFTSTIK